MIIGKRGQFFILAAVILAVIIIGLGVVYNTVNVSESSKKFYSYSAHLDEETGAVVDYSLYSGDIKVANFVNTSVVSVLNSYPELDVFACYTSSLGYNNLTCDNYGRYNISIYVDSVLVASVDTGQTIVTSELGESTGASSVKISPKSETFYVGSSSDLVVDSGGINYSIDLTKARTSSSQYYFIFRANTSAGNELVDQGGS